MAILRRVGISRISELIIDVDKDWVVKGIYNIKEIAQGMTIGDIAQHDGTKLVKLQPGPLMYVLTSDGPGKMLYWGPGGTYLNRYIPAWLYLSYSAGIFTPNRAKQLSAPLDTDYGTTGLAVPDINPDWFHNEHAVLSLPAPTVTGAWTPDHDEAIPASAIATMYFLDRQVGGAVADDGGATTDESAEAKSNSVIDQQYIVNDDAYLTVNGSNWFAQTFTTGLAQRIRGVWIKCHASDGLKSFGGTLTVSIKGVDGANHPTGLDLCAAYVDNPEVVEQYQAGDVWVYIPFTDQPNGTLLANATRYAIVIRSTVSFQWRADNSASAYAGGNREASTNGGASWTATATSDAMFKTVYTLDDMTLLPAAVAIGDAYYWGYYLPFNRIRQDVGVLGTGTYVLAFEYSTGGGGWAACVDLVDGTDRFHNPGYNDISHTPQGGWATDTIGGVGPLYWIRTRCTDAGAGYSQPIGDYAHVSVDF
jgi:hypothetical protein